MTQSDHKFITENLKFISEIESLKFSLTERWSNGEDRKIKYLELQLGSNKCLIEIPHNVYISNSDGLIESLNKGISEPIKPLLDSLKGQIKNKIC